MSKEIEQLVIELAVDSKDYNREMKALNNSIKMTEKAFKTASNGIENYEDTLEGAEHKVNSLRKQMDLQTQKLEAQERKYKELNNVLGDQRKELSRLEDELGKGSKEYQRQSKLVQQTAEKMQKLGSEMNTTKGQISKLSTALGDAEQHFNGLKESTSEFRKKLSELDNNFDAVSREVSEMENSFNGLDSELGETMRQAILLGEAFDTGKRKMALYEAEIDSLENNVKSLKPSYSSLRNEIADVNDALQKSIASYGANASGSQFLSQKLEGLKRDFAHVENEIKQNESACERLKSEYRELATTVDKTGAEFRALNLDRVKDDLNEIKERAMGVGVALGGMAIGGAIGLNEIENSALRISQGMKLTQGETDALEESMWDLQKSGLALEDVTVVLSEVGKTMKGVIDPGAIENYTAKVVSLGTTFDADYNDIVRASRSLMINFGIDSNKSLDLIATGFQRGADFNGDFLDTLKEYPGHYAKAGLSADDFLSTLIRGAELGVYNTDYVADAIKEMNIRLRDTPKATAEALGVIGITTTEVKNAIDENGNLSTEMIQKIITKVGDLDKKTMDAVGVQIFGTKWEDLSGQLIPIMDGIGSEIEGLSGASDEVYNSWEKTFGVEMRKTLARLKEPLMKIAMDVLPPLVDIVVELADKFNEWFGSMDDGSQKMVIGVTGLAAVFMPLLKNITNSIPLLMLFGKGLGGIGTASATTGASVGLLSGASGIGALVGSLSTALPLIIALGGAVGVGALAFKSYKDHIENEAIPSLNQLTSTLPGVSEATAQVVNEVNENFTSLKEKLWEVPQTTVEVAAQEKEVAEQLKGIYIDITENRKQNIEDQITALENGEGRMNEVVRKTLLNELEEQKKQTPQVEAEVQEKVNRLMEIEKGYGTATVEEQNRLKEESGRIMRELAEMTINEKVNSYEQENILRANQLALEQSANATNLSNTIKANQELRAEKDRQALEDYNFAVEQIDKMDGLTKTQRDNLLLMEANTYNDRLGANRKFYEDEMMVLQEKYPELITAINMKTGEVATAEEQARNRRLMGEYDYLRKMNEANGLGYSKMGDIVDSTTGDMIFDHEVLAQRIADGTLGINGNLDNISQGALRLMTDFALSNENNKQSILDWAEQVSGSSKNIVSDFISQEEINDSLKKTYGITSEDIKKAVGQEEVAIDVATGKVINNLKEQGKKATETGKDFDKSMGNVKKATEGADKTVNSSTGSINKNLDKQIVKAEDLGKSFNDNVGKAEDSIRDFNSETNKIPNKDNVLDSLGSGFEKTGSKASRSEDKISDYIDELNKIPSSKTTNIYTNKHETTYKKTYYSSFGSPEPQSLDYDSSIEVSERNLSEYKTEGGMFVNNSSQNLDIGKDIQRTAILKKILKVLEEKESFKQTNNIKIYGGDKSKNDDARMIAMKFKNELNKLKNENLRKRGLKINV